MDVRSQNSYKIDALYISLVRRFWLLSLGLAVLLALTESMQFSRRLGLPFVVVLICFALVIVLAIGGYRHTTAMQPGPRVPAFRETMASGKSLRWPLLRFGGARNMLVVTVVDGYLYTGLPAAFSWMADIWDLQHKVKLEDLKSERVASDRFKLSWTDETGLAVFSLKVRHPDEFAEAIQKSPIQVSEARLVVEKAADATMASATEEA
jgi:hypothetical protein